MLRLEKIYLENFKGVADVQIIDFGVSDLSILNGPNGFGKTTIFDVVELCLSGKLERTMQFNSIQKNNQNYKKPFYQNTIGKDVVVKILFRDSETSAPHIIIKVLDKDSTGKIGTSKAFRPDAWALFETFQSSDEASFHKPIDRDSIEVSSQEQIDQLFFGSTSLSHKNLYPSFNYLQQEENIYFLKKDEEEKKEELNFLFQTQEQAAELEKLNSILKGIKSTRLKLAETIAELGTVAAEGAVVPYLQLFTDKTLSYDAREPFAETSPANIPVVYHALLRDIEMLEEFVKAFDLQEYNKDRLKNAILYAADDDNILNAFALQHLYAGENYDKYNALMQKRIKYTRASENIANNIFDISVLEELGLTKAFIESYSTAIQEKSRQEKDIGQIGNIIYDLNNARKTALEKSLGLGQPISDPAHCPLCDTDFVTTDLLQQAVESKTEALESFNKSQLLRLGEINKALQSDYQEVVKEVIEQYLTAPENLLDQDFFSNLREYRGFEERIKRFQSILSGGGITFDDFILTQPVSLKQLNEHVASLRSMMITKLSDIVPDQEKLLHKQLFKELFSEDETQLLSPAEVSNKKKYIEYKFNEARMFSLNIFSERLARFTKLEGEVKTIRDKLDSAIKRYKMEMIEKIKIPFYLYSGKILQNYQQGLGIFIDMGATNRVRFLTDSESDHDIIHHLSSGQLAVVSIAFCLALNKVYETTNHFKFLAIDDPVQTLDDINIHSFIELMRHDFSDYQIVMSTHEDNIAAYLSYKFDKFGFNCKRIKVQSIFYPS